MFVFVRNTFHWKATTGHEIKYMIGTFDNGNLKITIDGSKNHARALVHIKQLCDLIVHVTCLFRLFYCYD
ncbi:MAG: hypothetical protein JWQ09_5142 [Segetibacter sp.]|nr:hypothetical protein [Segetibacter sp.]